MNILLNLKRLYYKIKNLVYSKNMEFEFTNVRVKILEDKINVAQNAKTDGKLNLPPSESEHVSKCENEAIIQADEFRASQVAKANTVLKNLEKITDSQSQLDQDNFHIANFKNEINDQIINADGKLSNLKDIFDREDHQVRNFNLKTI